MDWENHRLVSEQPMQYLLVVSLVVACVTGYIMSSFKIMLHIYSVGVLITFLMVVPDWKFFYRSPMRWFEPIRGDAIPRATQTHDALYAVKKSR